MFARALQALAVLALPLLRAGFAEMLERVDREGAP
jgi:hypothetical protein